VGWAVRVLAGISTTWQSNPLPVKASWTFFALPSSGFDMPNLL
jgi:hypothetical protein